MIPKLQKNEFEPMGKPDSASIKKYVIAFSEACTYLIYSKNNFHAPQELICKRSDKKYVLVNMVLQ